MTCPTARPDLCPSVDPCTPKTHSEATMNGSRFLIAEHELPLRGCPVIKVVGDDTVQISTKIITTVALDREHNIIHCWRR